MTIPRAAMAATALGAAALVGWTGPVPASAAPDPGLSRYLGQRLDWGACPADAPDLAEAGARCARVTVPLDYSAPGGRSIELAISRIRGGDRAHRRGILLTNPGGPGGPGLDHTARLRPAMGEAADRYDLIGFDPRFVGRSTPIRCGPSPRPEPTHSRREAFDASVRKARETAQRCYEHGDNAALLPHASSRNVVRDMDLIRAVLGERKLSYYGVSYGADLGAAYTQAFPGNADRVVIDSVTDPRLTQYENFQAAGEAQERGLDEWAAWTARRHGEYRLGDTPARVRAVVERLGSRVDDGPLPIGDHTLDASVLGLFLRQMVGGEENDATLARAVRNLVDAADGRDVRPIPELSMWLELFTSPDPALDNLFNSGNAIFCGDGGWPAGGWPDDPERHWRDTERARRTQPVFAATANAVFPCPFWKTEPREPGIRIGNRVPLLMLQATRDNNVPHAGAVAMRRKLQGSRLISADIRAHGVYGRGTDGLTPVPCVDQAVNAYLRTGTLPPADSTCRRPSGRPSTTS
ncbi:alpha/beta hydrolase [Actinomadura viridis]|uniref:Pimeloyl-ACP methyl ester carboxylesterase n=1 Tax=Actinomadura viridis TaxID=58110 RepID=A0A931DP03_9ACTN|nr:alpha/beta hydrolase [Actinomadura viridis]MBG6091126.1 pimeloyl-ACP methyl ester carboxylesterase [Actinomadura viridis]